MVWAPQQLKRSASTLVVAVIDFTAKLVLADDPSIAVHNVAEATGVQEAVYKSDCLVSRRSRHPVFPYSISLAGPANGINKVICL